MTACVSPQGTNSLDGCVGEGGGVIQKRYLTAGMLGHDELVTVDMWLMTVIVYMHKSVGTAGWLRTVKKWCVIGRVEDGELLNLGFCSPVQSIA